MNRALISYTPRVKPTGYNSLKNRAGCQVIVGNNKYATLAFNNICVEPS